MLFLQSPRHLRLGGQVGGGEAGCGGEAMAAPPRLGSRNHEIVAHLSVECSLTCSHFIRTHSPCTRNWGLYDRISRMGGFVINVSRPVDIENRTVVVPRKEETTKGEEPVKVWPLVEAALDEINADQPTRQAAEAAMEVSDGCATLAN